MSHKPPPDDKAPRILVIDDDTAMLQSVARVLRTEGFGEPLLCADPKEAEALLKSHPVGAILLDLVMPHIPGEKLLGTIIEAYPAVPVVVVTATNEVETAVRCVRAGAMDYLVKPVNFSRLLATVAQALRQYDVRTENVRLQNLIRKPILRHPECFAAIATQSPAMHALFRHIEAIAPSREPVMIVGETGVGKELVARALHTASGRPGAMLAVNVAGIDDTAFADTLFGHVKGAFTGADRDREGVLERAGDGTIFLDEIGDLGMDMQTKLLRLIQENEFFPLGSDCCRRSRCRVIAATNRDLRVRMRENRFREDLYYRLHGHLIRVPPLRERTGDIPLLVEQFLKEASDTLDKPIPTTPKELAVHLSAYPFPGNIRELRTMVVDAVARHEKGVLSLDVFHEHMDRVPQMRGPDSSSPPSLPSGPSGAAGLPTLEHATRSLIVEAVKRANGNQGAAARILGISRRTVNRYLRTTGGKTEDQCP